MVERGAHHGKTSGTLAMSCDPKETERYRPLGSGSYTLGGDSRRVQQTAGSRANAIYLSSNLIGQWVRWSGVYPDSRRA